MAQSAKSAVGKVFSFLAWAQVCIAQFQEPLQWNNENILQENSDAITTSSKFLDINHDPASWSLTTHSFMPNQFQRAPYVSNGYFGQALSAEGFGHWTYRRSDGSEEHNVWPLEESRTTFGTISGFWDLQDTLGQPDFPDVLKNGGNSVISGIPNWTGLIVTMPNGESFTPGVKASSVKQYSQSWSLRDGVVQTNITWSPPYSSEAERITIELGYTLLAHQTRKNLALVRLDLSADKETDMIVTDILDGSGAIRSDFVQKAGENDRVMWTSVKPRGISDSIAYVCSSVKFTSCDYLQTLHKSGVDIQTPPWISKNDSTISRSWNLHLKKHQNISIYKYVGITHSNNPSSNLQALELAKSTSISTSEETWSQLLKEHFNAWEQMWDSADIEIPTNLDLQLTARTSLFHLLTNTVQDSDKKNQNSISVGGLGSDSYGGMIFWDAETWIYPSLVSLYPSHAKTVVDYRSRMLPQAKSNAQNYNFSGALFPWTSSKFGNCTSTGLCTHYQYHINFDVALAFWQYFLVTGDEKWLREEGWEVIREVADMFAGFLKLNGNTGRYETLLMADPDEYAVGVNNSAYTNTGVKKLLGEWAPAAARILGLNIPERWLNISTLIEIPTNQDGDLILEYTGMEANGFVKQASVPLMTYPLGWTDSEEIARNNLDYYTPLTSPIGPAMSWPTFAIVSAQTSLTGCATYTYLLLSYEPYIRAPFYQFSEVISDDWKTNGGFPPAFPFLTAHGGFLQIFTHGFTGMRFGIDHILFDPMIVPQLEDGIRIKGIKFREGSLDIEIGLEFTTITRNAGNTSSKHSIRGRKSSEPVTVFIGGKSSQPGTHLLYPGDSFTVPTRRPDLNDTSIMGNLAQCKKVISDDPYVSGHIPIAVTDGSNATIWQPQSSADASITIDLGKIVKTQGIWINWANIPAREFAVYGCVEGGFEFAKILEMTSVDISEPYRENEAKLVKIRRGNETMANFDRSHEVRYVRLEIRGTYDYHKARGATVAEVGVF